MGARFTSPRNGAAGLAIASLVLLAAGYIADCLTTARAFARGFRERNPILSRLGLRGIELVKAAVAIGAALGVWLVYGLAGLPYVGVIGLLWLLAAMWNLRQMRKAVIQHG